MKNKKEHRDRSLARAALLGAASVAGACTGEGDHATTGTAAQAVVNCTRDMRVDPLQAGPAAVVAFGALRVLAIGQEATRNGNLVPISVARTGLVDTRWSAATGQWSGFEYVASGAIRSPSGVFVGGALHVNSLDANGQLIGYVNTGSWGAPLLVGTLTLDSSPVSVMVGSGARLFARAATTRVIHERLGTSTWAPMGDQVMTSAPAAAAIGNRVVLFARGLDDGLMVRVESAGVWGPWRRMTAWNHGIASAPTAVSLFGNVYVYALNPQGAVVEAYSADWGDTWQQGGNLGGTLTSSPTAAWDGARLWIIGRSADGNRLVQRYYDGVWRDWQTVNAGTVTANVCALAAAAQVTNVSYARSACTGAVASTELCSAAGCGLIARWPCYPWACDGVACRTEGCRANADCANGAQCEMAAGTCVPVDSTCRDAFTTISASGMETSCAPYKCQAGACRGECNDGNDCASGFVCMGQKCVQACVNSTCAPSYACNRYNYCSPGGL